MNITIYSKDNCPNCIKVKNLLQKYNPEILLLDKDITRKDFFKKFPNSKSLPQIIINQKYIGGYKDLEKWLAFNIPNNDF
tara:strand:+ start:346 stop:585 length:240 start_codon:yes stop_codon:yes gene_type:complete